MLKVHATRIPAPTAEQPYGTKWQVAVTDNDGTMETFDRVEFRGPSQVVALPEGVRVNENPRVWIEPIAQTDVLGWRNERVAKRYWWYGERTTYGDALR